MSGDSARAATAGLSLQLAKIGTAIALTFVAGYVDALGWLTLDRVFTAQMSGNLVLLAVHIVAGESGHTWLQADALIAFFGGLVITGSAIEIGMRRRWRRIFIAALALEFFLLLCFARPARRCFPAAAENGQMPVGQPMLWSPSSPWPWVRRTLRCAWRGSCRCSQRT